MDSLCDLGRAARFISPREIFWPAANSPRALAMISRNSGCELKDKDSRSIFSRDTNAAIGLFRLVKTTAPFKFFAYSTNDFEAVDSSRVLIVLPLYRQCARRFLASDQPPIPAQFQAPRQPPHKRPGASRPAIPRAPQDSVAKVSGCAFLEAVRATNSVQWPAALLLVAERTERSSAPSQTWRILPHAARLVPQCLLHMDHINDPRVPPPRRQLRSVFL